jgi:zinc protease
MRLRLSFLGLFLLLLWPRTSLAQEVLDIPYQQFVLDNGLTLIVHEDRKAPIVAVNLWYHVGSKNERRGKTGFAHLFEHLMFNGSENFNDDYFQVLERIGATDLNGTTNTDRTNYFQNVPTPALDQVLWMESDRMGHLLGAIDQAKLDEQRGVVQNEKRQGENQPYGGVWEHIAFNTYPASHPYSWTTIGSMEDLNAASLEDVHQWFKDYYGAANAVIVVAGDIDAQTAKAKVEQYFGDIPAGPPVAKQDTWVAKMVGTHRMTMQDRVPQARVYKVWNVPEWGHPEMMDLQLVASLLTGGKTSRLYKRLVYDDQIATDVTAFVSDGEIGSQFMVWATARPGTDLTVVEKALDEEMARLLAEGPTEREVERVKTQYLAGVIRGAERIGGFGGKSDLLAESAIYGGTPEAYKANLRRIQQATAVQLRTTANTWLSDGVFILDVHPFPQYTHAETGVDRTQMPQVGPSPTAQFPAMQKATLSNGLKVVLAERHTIPVVNFNLMFNAGYAADQFAQPGTASLTMAMLDEGTTTKNALQISEELAMLGATLGTGSDLDASSVTLSTLKQHLDAALGLYADVILNPAFPESDLQLLKRQQLARIQREKVTPVQMALRVFPKLLYSEGHAYSQPLTGSGTEAVVNALTRADLQRFHQTWFKPNNATLIVVGDITMNELRPKLETLFRTWQRGDVPRKNVGTVAQKTSQTVYLLDRPGSQQSIIFAGHLAPPKGNPDEIALQTMNGVLGGNFTSRINMNLREDKHWSYGASSFFWDAQGQRPFIVYAAVQTDKTMESMQEIGKELNGMLGERPILEAELELAKNAQTLTLPGQWETAGAVGASIAEIVKYGLPENYFETFVSQVNAMNTDKTLAAARKALRPSGLVWVVVGDRAMIEAGLRELNLGDIRLLDADGNPMAGTP